jgi:hypothetical protein
MIAVEVDRHQMVVDSPVAFVHDGRRYGSGRHQIGLAARA